MSKGEHYIKATAEEQAEWQKNDRDWWANNALKFVVWGSILQIATILFMGLNFYLIDLIT